MALKDHSINMEAMKALVAIVGPAEAARQAGVKPPTMFSWCQRYKWKKLSFIPKTSGKNGYVKKPDAADVIIQALENMREKSTVHLAKFTERAARQAAKHKDPLSVAKHVRDVAYVHGTVWPKENQNELIESAILMGAAKVTDNVQELEAHVREALPDQRPEGD